ncbi:hypothetical protein GCM10025871_42170 [Deinococcus metallilatus]|nr:hypothetical protein GCM10025871_42170 [Deinococcus metallilatus]
MAVTSPRCAPERLGAMKGGLDTILNHLKAAGATVLLEDVVRRSPLLFEHVNVLGRDHVELSPLLAQGA